jgi:hypothetical protein
MTSSTTMTTRDAETPDRSADRRARRTTSTAYSALGWVVLFFAFHIYWYCGGSFASPGELPPLGAQPNHLETAAGLHSLVSWTVNLIVTGAWPLGALVCVTVARGWARGRLALATQALVWVGFVLLLLRGVSGLLDDVTRATGLLPNGITGLSLEATTGHVHLRWADWAIDSYFLVGGIVFWLLAVRYRAQRAHSRPRRAADHTVLPQDPPAIEPLAGRPVPAWAIRLAHAIPLLVLPSGLWRLAVALGFSMGMLNDAGEPSYVRGWAAVYVVAITLLAEAVGLTALGLVRPWGEVAPAWLPFIGGRPVRPRIAIRAATAGSVALMLIWTVGFWPVWTGDQASDMASPFWAVVFALCYAPLNLWGPALLVLTWAYHRRRSHLEPSHPAWAIGPGNHTVGGR